MYKNYNASIRICMHANDNAPVYPSLTGKYNSTSFDLLPRDMLGAVR